MLNALKPNSPLKNQSGINMVDLMMWLVIAALLLAAAIQGIGYYQKAAHLSNMKQAAYDAGTNSFAVAANNEGVVDEGVVTTAVSDTKWTEGTSYSVEGSDSPYIRVTDPAVADQEIIYLFESCGDYPVGVNVVPVGGTPTLESCGVAATAPSDGSGSGGQAGNEVAETADFISYIPITNVAEGHNANVIAYLNTEIKAYAHKSLMGTDWDAFDAAPVAQEWYATYPMSTSAKDYIDYLNFTERVDDPTVVALLNAYWDSDTAYWDSVYAYTDRVELDPSTEGDTADVQRAQRELVDAMSAWYTAVAALPMPSTPMVVSASAPNDLMDKTVTTGSTTSITIKYDTPDILNVAGAQDRFRTLGALHSSGVSTWKWDFALYGVANSPTSMTITQTIPAPSGGGWKAGPNEVLVGVKDMQSQIIHYSTFEVIGQ